jgi:hypothetical protein
MVSIHPDRLDRIRDIEGEDAGLVTRIDVGLLGCDVVDRQETIGITAHHVISGKSDDTPDVVALVDMDGHQLGHRTQDPAHRGTVVGTSFRTMIGQGMSAIEDDKVPRCSDEATPILWSTLLHGLHRPMNI